MIDGLGGLVGPATGGLISFGDPNTDRYHGGVIAGVIVTIGIDPKRCRPTPKGWAQRPWRTAPERSTTAASRLGSVSVPGPVCQPR